MAYFSDPYGAGIRGLENVQQTIRDLSQQYIDKKRDERAAQLQMKQLELDKVRVESEQEIALTEAEMRKRQSEMDAWANWQEAWDRERQAGFETQRIGLASKEAGLREQEFEESKRQFGVTQGKKIPTSVIRANLDPTEPYHEPLLATVDLWEAMGITEVGEEDVKSAVSSFRNASLEFGDIRSQSFEIMKNRINEEIQGQPPWSSVYKNFEETTDFPWDTELHAADLSNVTLTDEEIAVLGEDLTGEKQVKALAQKKIDTLLSTEPIPRERWNKLKEAEESRLVTEYTYYWKPSPKRKTEGIEKTVIPQKTQEEIDLQYWKELKSHYKMLDNLSSEMQDTVFEELFNNNLPIEQIAEKYNIDLLGNIIPSEQRTWRQSVFTPTPREVMEQRERSEKRVKKIGKAIEWFVTPEIPIY